MPRVSILMGVYNEKKHSQVEQAINSVLEQTYSDFELIICDDGSDISEYMWLKTYCERDERINLYRNPKNQGLSYTLNCCLKHATGEYIARMDADDQSLPFRLQKQVEFLDKNPEYALVGCNVAYFDEEGVWGHRVLDEKPNRYSFLRTSPFVHPSIMMRRSILDQLGGYTVSQEVLRVEDYELFMRLYANGYQGYNLQEEMFWYREDAKSYKKRKYKYRVNEMRTRYRGYRSMGIHGLKLCYALKPLVAGLLPMGLIRNIHKSRFKTY